MTIYGVGTDLCDIRRMAKALERHGERFAQRVLGDAELAIYRARTVRSPARGLRFLATRFSAKEAFSKAIGLGLHAPMSWRLCEILKEPSGKPYVRLHGSLAAWCATRGLVAHVSVTDEVEYAAAYVVVEKTSGASSPDRQSDIP